MVATATEPQIIHALPGRIRLRVPPGAPPGLKQRLEQIPGVSRVEVNPLTGNALISFQPPATDPAALLEAARAHAESRTDGSEVDAAPQPTRRSSIAERAVSPAPELTRARIPVRGIDRNPRLARRAVEILREMPGVRHAQASPLTGRVLVEYVEREIPLDDILETLAGIELPPLPGEDRPDNPLDSAPLYQSATRTAGAALGLTLLAARQITRGAGAASGSNTAAQVAAILGLLRGFPIARDGFRRLLGRHGADFVFGTASIVSLTLAESPIGLAVQAAEGLRLLTEVLARRAAFRRLEAGLTGAPAAEPGAVIQLETGEQTPGPGLVREGQGSATGPDGLPMTIGPGDAVPAGARLFGGPFLLELGEQPAFTPSPRPAPPTATVFDRYLRLVGPVSLGFAALTGLRTRSLSRAFQALVLVNAAPALVGKEVADQSAAAHVLRAGVTVIGTRPERVIRRPAVLFIDSVRPLTDRTELSALLPITDAYESVEILELASGLAAAAGSPWGGAFRTVTAAPVKDVHIEGGRVFGVVGGTRYSLGPSVDDRSSAARRLRERGEFVLALRQEDWGNEGRTVALISLKPRLAPGLKTLREIGQRDRIELVAVGADTPSARAVARRASIDYRVTGDLVTLIRERQRAGQIVAVLADSADAAPAFAACDLGIGLSDGRGHFPARADLIAPDLEAVAAILAAGARRDRTVADATALSVLANVIGAGWDAWISPGVEQATRWLYAATFGGILDALVRLRGGARRRSLLAAALEPQPERWGRLPVEEVLAAFKTRREGLSGKDALRRRQRAPLPGRRYPTLQAAMEQLTSPLTGLLGIGAGVSLLMGAPVDLAIIGATIAANVAIGTWQERRAGQAIQALEELASPSALVLRDGAPRSVPATEVVPGDVLLLAAGARVPADARLIDDHTLEVDEAALTGESVPVWKSADGPTDAARIVLEGSDVLSGSGRAVAVAVGRRTRLGVTAAALASEAEEQSPLGVRLGRMLSRVLPIAAGSGALVTLSGLLRGGSPLPQLGLGATLAVTAIPEGLPLLARVSEAGVARRLARHGALVRRLGAVEALGRVDVACADKTGTLTIGKLRLQVVAGLEESARLPGELPAELRRVLLAGALASPAPDTPDIGAHPTDLAVVRAAEAADLAPELARERRDELPFDPVRAYHATAIDDRLYLKGAPEVLIPRCTQVVRSGRPEAIDQHGCEELMGRVQQLAEQGLRVLMVAEGAANQSLADPRDLTALGFLGIRDPLRPMVRTAVQHCHEAGIRVVMITGDHPATARAIGREAGLLNGAGEVITAAEIVQLENGDLDRRLERTTVIARATPLDKVRIVESLQRSGHTVAMTGDGVNDAPALRLADVGVAMGRGTEVARQASDLVLARDDFSSLVEALVEGRSFWSNTRRALGLLLGGNLGELAMVAGASVLGLPTLATRQILAVNLITDIFPGLAVALQRPEHRRLARLAREGTAALDTTLRRDVARRTIATGLPAFAAEVAAVSLGLPDANAVGFASIVLTQLVQTLDVGRGEGGLNRGVVAGVVAASATLAASLALAPVRAMLALTLPTPLGWGLIGLASLSALLLSRLLSRDGIPALPATAWLGEASLPAIA